METSVATRVDIFRPESTPALSTGSRIPLIIGVLALAATIPYLPFLSLPLISDDYIQLMLGRQYGPLDGWSALSDDVLYRSRATSIIVTHWIDSVLGPSAIAHRAVNVLFHLINVLLLACCGFWKRIGWRVSVPAAAVFALMEMHQEAVVWSAALPELLVFTFALGSLMSWVKWIDGGNWKWGALSIALFGFALLSKESGVIVVPLAGLVWLREARDRKAPLAALAVMAIASLLYAYAIFTASDSHLHLNDGTFAIHAPFVKTLSLSTLRLMWPWGWMSLFVLWHIGLRRNAALLSIAAVWVVLAFLPYSFLTYMDRVPSRHTYSASLGLALIVACAWVTLLRIKGPSWATAFAIAFVLGNLGYLWTKKLDQYQRRAEPTEHFLRFAAQSDTPIRITCSPYSFEAYRHAARIRLGKPLDFVSGPQDPTLDRRNYCDTSKP